jgi:hypothetical protein
MADKRQWGPIGTNYEEIPQSDSDWMPPSRSMSSTHPQGAFELTAEEQELLTDLAQLVLDLIGIVEPTPFADGANAVISVTRGDYLGAALSGLGILPYLGDLAKAGKIPNYSRKISRAIDLARVDQRFAQAITPVFEAIRKLLDRVPREHVPSEIRKWIDQLQKPLDDFLGAARRLSKADRLTRTIDAILLTKFGSVAVAPVVRQNVQTAVEFMMKYDLKTNKMLELMSGMDLHTANSVRTLTLQKGERLIQYIPPPRGTLVDQADKKIIRDFRKTLPKTTVRSPGGGVGEWFVRVGGGTGIPNSGIAHGARRPQMFEVRQSIAVLETRASSVTDGWTSTMPMHGPYARRAKSPIEMEDGMPKIGTPQQELLKKLRERRVIRERGEAVPALVTANGGGKQILIPAIARSKPAGASEYYSDRWRMYLEMIDAPRRR